MEVGSRPTLIDRLKNVFLREPIPFTSRREVNWRAVKIMIASSISLAVIVLLLLPTSEPEQTSYLERGDGPSARSSLSEATLSDETLRQFEQGRTNMAGVPKHIGYLGTGSAGMGNRSMSGDRNSSMIITRGGLDSRTQLPPGSRVRVRLLEKVTLANQSLPVIGEVSSDFVHEDGLAIPEGAKVFGEASFDSNDDRAQISWRAVQMPDGRQRPFSAISVGLDGQVGVSGKVHSDGVKNTVGQTLTRFIGAYAEGSMQRGAFGGNPGGSENGFKNAVAEPAKDRAEAWAEDLKKERRWIEVSSGVEFSAVLREPFTYRDPGGHLN